MRRHFPSVFILLALMVTASGASGQIQSEADAAADLLEGAEEALDAAESRRAVALDDLFEAITDWQGVIESQTALAFEVAELRSSIESAERTASELRDQVRQRAVDAYMAGGVGMLDTLMVADSLSDIATAEIVLESMGRQADEDLRSLIDEQLTLESLRVQLAVEEDALAKRNREVGTLVDELDILFADADADVVASHEALLAADVAYRAAYELLQQMTELRRSGGFGVERWRPIVEHYFPADRVQQALEVMWCESRGNPEATHPLSGASGLFQFMEQTWGFVSPLAGFAGASRYDPEANVASAAWLLSYTIDRGHARGDWGRWSCQPATVVP